MFFHGMSCFSLLSSHNVQLHRAPESVSSEFEAFEVPNMPHRVKITKAQLPGSFVSLPDFDDFRDMIREAESSAYGVVVNSFDELENGCVELYAKAVKKKVWCIEPVSLFNKDHLHKCERGNRASIDVEQCLKWLDSFRPKSVIYACLCSQCRLVALQLIELGLRLEASEHPFIWVVAKGEKISEFEKWLEDEKFEARTEGRWLLISDALCLLIFLLVS